jgi:acyl CoA:acetate/3-ketoacid CoA transferase alpha subunit
MGKVIESAIERVAVNASRSVGAVCCFDQRGIHSALIDALTTLGVDGLEVELTPQRSVRGCRRAGALSRRSITRTGVGTQVAHGALPWRYGSDGAVLVRSPAERVEWFETREGARDFVLEHAIVPDFGLVRASKDRGDLCVPELCAQLQRARGDLPAPYRRRG